MSPILETRTDGLPFGPQGHNKSAQGRAQRRPGYLLQNVFRRPEGATQMKHLRQPLFQFNLLPLCCESVLMMTATFFAFPKSVAPLQGSVSSWELVTQGDARGFRRLAVPWADL
jgi:hypothetical protein